MRGGGDNLLAFENRARAAGHGNIAAHVSISSLTLGKFGIFHSDEAV
jgi:hypothetical protein